MQKEINKENLNKYIKYYKDLLKFYEFMSKDKEKTGKTEEELKTTKYSEGIKHFANIYQELLLDQDIKHIEQFLNQITNYIYSKCLNKPNKEVLKAKIFELLITNKLIFLNENKEYPINENNLEKINKGIEFLNSEVDLSKVNPLYKITPENKDEKLISEINFLIRMELYDYITYNYNISTEDFLILYNYYFTKEDYKNKITKEQMIKMFSKLENIVILINIANQIGITIDSNKISHSETLLISSVIKSFLNSSKAFEYLCQKERCKAITR